MNALVSKAYISPHSCSTLIISVPVLDLSSHPSTFLKSLHHVFLDLIYQELESPLRHHALEHVSATLVLK